jgi:hypothetical protein
MFVLQLRLGVRSSKWRGPKGVEGVEGGGGGEGAGVVS